MPVVRIENAGTLTAEQKKRLIKEVTLKVSEITGKPESSIYLRIDEVNRENFGVGGVPLG